MLTHPQGITWTLENMAWRSVLPCSPSGQEPGEHRQFHPQRDRSSAHKVAD